MHDFLCRFKLGELRLACGDVADAQVEILQQSPSQHVDSVAKIDQNLVEIGGDVTEDTGGNSDEEMMSDDELEELHEFMLTQRRRNSGTQVPQSVSTEEKLSSNEDSKNNSDSEEEDIRILSQELLQKLEETFSGDVMENESGILSGTVEEEVGSETYNIVSDLPSSVHVHVSDQLMAALDSNHVKENDTDTSSATEVLSDQEDVALLSELEESIVAECVEGDKTADQQMSDSAQQHHRTCETLKDSQTDNATLASATDKDAASDDDSGLVSKMPAAADALEDKPCSDNAADNNLLQQQPVSPVLPSRVQSSSYSTASPPSLFEESSLELWDLERMNAMSADKDKSASADDGNHTLDFIDVDELINLCESPNDLFESPLSHKSPTSPTTSPQVQSEISCQQGNRTLPSSPISTSSPVGTSQMQLDVQTPLFSCKSSPAPVENLQTQLDSLTEQGDWTPTAAVEVDDIIELKSLPGNQLHGGSENRVVSRHGGLRKVRAKTRNSLSSDCTDVSHYSSTHASDVSRTSSRLRSNKKISRPVYSDVEPDSDVTESESEAVSPRNSRASAKVSLFRRSSASVQTPTKECSVKLTRIEDANLLPQVNLHH